MAKFIVAPKLFEIFPEACFGVVIAESVDNQKASSTVTGLLESKRKPYIKSLAVPMCVNIHVLPCGERRFESWD